MRFKYVPAYAENEKVFVRLPPSTWMFIWQVVRPVRWVLLVAYTLLACSVILTTAYPYFMGRFIDGLIGNAPEAMINAWWILILAVFFQAVFSRAGNYFAYRKAMPRILAKARSLPYQHILGQDMAVLREHSSGVLLSYIANIKWSIRGLLDISLSSGIGIIFGYAVSLSIIATLPLPFLLVVVAWGLIAGFTAYWAGKRVGPVTQAMLRHDAQVADVMVDGLSNSHAVKGFANEEHEYAAYRQDSELHAVSSVRWQSMWDGVGIIQEVSHVLLVVTVGTLVIWYWPQGHLTAGQVAMLLPICFDLVERTWMTVRSFTSISEDVTTLRESFNTIYQPYQLIDVPDAELLRAARGGVSFKKASFAYGQKEKTVLKQLNLEIKPGQKVGLVGHSGAGKSTLMNLLLRFYDVQKGSIEIDGQNIAKVTQQSLRRHMVMVPQDTALFNRSILDNIRYGRPEASEAEVIEAAKKAHAHSFIEKLAKGYDSKVGERGVKLSGGQRQRIAIARAFLSAPKIVLLDEATSALDSESEVAIQKSLATLMKGRTVVAIAHRLSTLRQMDRIVVMDEGRVVEDGTHAQLLKKKNGVYARLWQLQKDGFIQEGAD